MVVGSKAKVFHGNADKTSGGLRKEDLMQNKHGRIVSVKKHEQGKVAIENLKKAGYTTEKGKFELFKKK